MAVTPQFRGQLHRFGFRLGDAYAAIRWAPHDPDTHKTITDGSLTGVPTVAIYGADGTTVKLAAANMVDDADGFWLYRADLSNTTTFPAGQYQAQFAYVIATRSEVRARRRMGIYANIPEPTVSDETLSAMLFDVNDYLGGRSNWAQLIAQAWTLLLLELGRERRPDGTEMDPFEVADSTEYNDAHLWRTLQLVAMELRNSDPDRFGRLAENYAEEYQRAYKGIVSSQLSRWQTGPTVVAEVRESDKVRSAFQRYGADGSDGGDTAARRVRSTPRVTTETRW